MAPARVPDFEGKKMKKIKKGNPPKTEERSAPRLADPIAAATDTLLHAVDEWVRANGGKLLMVGGIEVQKWTGDRAGQFRVAIGCLGQMPIQDAIGAKRPVAAKRRRAPRA